MAKKQTKSAAKKQMKKPAAKAAQKSAKKSATKAAPKKPVTKKAKAVAKSSAAKKAVGKSVAKSAPKKALSKKPVAKVLKTVAKKLVKEVKKAVLPASPSKKSASSKSSPKLKMNSDLAKMISPLDDRILVEVVEVADRTPGGLYIPDSVDRNDRHKQGTVVAVGRGHVGRKGKLRPLDVQLGDIVLFDHWQGSPIEVGGKDVIVLRESQLLGVVKP